jgi:hypothetical protein
MPTPVRAAPFLLLVALTTSCSEPTASTAVRAVKNEPVTPMPAPGFPALSKPGTIFLEASSVYARPNKPAESRYVLYDDGTHALQLSTYPQAMEFTGRWTRTDSIVQFEWDGWSTAGPWGATGTLRGNELAVRYNVIMMLTDFEDATYLRTPN